MEDYYRKGKRRPSLAHKQYPTATHGPLRPPPRARVPTPIPPRTIPEEHLVNVSATTPTPTPTPRPTRAPRKRFRKKVTGLFGDQTDLQKRMQKLLRPLTEDILVKKRVSQFTDTSKPNIELEQLTTSTVTDTLSLAKQVVNELDKRVSKEDTRKPEVIVSSMSTRALASIAKWKKFQNRIGRMSPRSNELFLNEVDVCTQSPNAPNLKDRFDPPTLPNLSPTTTSPIRIIDNDSTLNSTIGSRMGTPAMLRRKVRRNERGYRGSEVLRIRSGLTKEGVGNTSEIPHRTDTISPAALNRRGPGPTPSGGLDCYVRSLGDGGDSISITRRTRSNMVKDNEGRQPMTRRSRSEATSTDGRRSAPKRRRVSDESSSSETHQPQVNAISLLIEAAEKESNGNTIIRSDTAQDELPPRKTKRLRSSGCMTGSSESSMEHRSERRHTTLGVKSSDEEDKIDEMMPQARVRGRRGDGRIRAERGTIGKRKRGAITAKISHAMEADSGETADEKTDND